MDPLQLLKWAQRLENTKLGFVEAQSIQKKITFGAFFNRTSQLNHNAIVTVKKSHFNNKKLVLWPITILQKF